MTTSGRMSPRLRAAGTLALGTFLAAGCATTGTAKTTPANTAITASEKKQGSDAHPSLLAEFGGAYDASQAAYVRRVGQNIAVQSGLSNARSDFTVTLLNSPVNNAFAIPGGYVYVTRQLMALMNNEAELAGVLGHEVGHVAARHSKSRQKAAQRNAILGVLGTVLGGAIGDNGGLLGTLGGALQNNAMQAAQYFTLGFSRKQELEADALGVRYLASAGYDPMAMSTVLASLANQNALEARLQGKDARAMPEWASTHPDPASRVRNAQALANRSGKVGGTLNAEPFLNALNGVLYGDDPVQGVVEGRDFLHPEMRLKFTVPNGYAMQNGTQAVNVTGQGGQAEFTLAPYNGDLSSYVSAVFRQVGGDKAQLSPDAIRSTTVNGLPTAYAQARANTQNGQVDVTVFAYEFAKDRAYHFLAITPAGRASTFDSMFGSVRRLSSAEASAVRPRKVQVVTVRSGDTLRSLASRMAYTDAQMERFLVLNGLPANATLRSGQRVKIVTY